MARGIVLLVLVMLVQACGQVVPPTPTAAPLSPSPTAPSAPSPTRQTALASPTSQAAPASPTTTRPVASATAAIIPTVPSIGPISTPDLASDNVFATILGASDAPPGWTVRPCDGNGPLLCLFSGEELVGRIELSMWHLETRSDVEALLRQQGLTPGAIDYRKTEHAQKITAALLAFVDDYHDTFEHDRNIRYAGQGHYTRLETQPVQVGTIPGIRYGFTVTDQAGLVQERWLSFAAFDGTLLYLLVPHYDAGSIFTFISDAELQRFEPYLPRLIAGLRLPLPVQETSVRAVVTRGGMPAPVFRFYAVGSTPVVELPAGQTLQVTGQSPNQQWWRVACPVAGPGECWVSADPQQTVPTAR